MGVTISWYENLPDVVYYEFVTPWTWKDYEAAFKHELALAAQISGSGYHVIADLSKGIPIPRSAGFTVLIQTIQQSPPTFKAATIIGKSTLLNMMLILLNQIYPAARDQIIIVPTVEDAHTWIIEARQRDQLTTDS